jgi:hypothetical protein
MLLATQNCHSVSLKRITFAYRPRYEAKSVENQKFCVNYMQQKSMLQASARTGNGFLV